MGAAAPPDDQVVRSPALAALAALSLGCTERNPAYEVLPVDAHTVEPAAAGPPEPRAAEPTDAGRSPPDLGPPAMVDAGAPDLAGPDAVLAPPDAPAARGLKGEYFTGIDLTRLRLTRIDPTVNFEWRWERPAPELGTDYFSVRWTGWVQAPTTETYTFYAHTDDGVRLWIEGRLMIDDWREHPVTENAANLPLVAGRRYAVRMEYFEGQEIAVARPSWSRPSAPNKVPIPETALTAAP